jgi:hypothetical protein
MKEPIRDDDFVTALNEFERGTWNIFKVLTQNFLGNHPSLKHSELVDDIVESYKE